MEHHYCWRCKVIVPFLDETEWQKISPLMDDHINAIKAYRQQHGVGLKEGR